MKRDITSHKIGVNIRTMDKQLENVMPLLQILPWHKNLTVNH